MDVKQIEYILQIAEEKSITKAAEKLFMTQSALNQQLLKIEKELGAPLFVRSRTDWQMTEIGQIYCENASRILQIKKETYNRISDLTTLKQSHLTIGLTPDRGITMFADIYPAFHEKHPNVTLEPIEADVKTQQKMIDAGKIDIGFLTLIESQKKNQIHHLICTEEIFLAVPSHLYRDTLTLSDLSQETFVLLKRSSTLREVIDPLFQTAGFVPEVLFETKSPKTALKMAGRGIACTLIPECYIQSSKSVRYISLPEHPCWELCAVYKKGAYISQAMRDFIEMAEEYWKNQL